MWSQALRLRRIFNTPDLEKSDGKQDVLNDIVCRPLQSHSHIHHHLLNDQQSKCFGQLPTSAQPSTQTGTIPPFDYTMFEHLTRKVGRYTSRESI